MKKISIISAFLGTLMEVYDFTVFAFLIPTLSDVFFPGYEKKIAINFTILTYITSYAVKPLGALFFGYMIDSYGRKNTLLVTTLLMALATAVIGLLPSNMENLYPWGFVLIACRVLQGLSISGEFSAAIIVAVEHGGKRPALAGSMAFVGGSLGLLIANLSVYLLLHWMSHESMIQYGWRIPFLISMLCWFVLFLVRNRIDELAPRVDSIKSRFRELFLTHRKELVLIFVTSSLSASAFYMTFVFMPTLLTEFLSAYSHEQSILVTFFCLAIYVLALPVGGVLADKIGVMRQVKIAAVFYLLFSIVCFSMISGLSRLACIEALVFFVLIQALLNSALPAFMVTRVNPMHRGKALAMSYSISLTLFGGLMPYLILTNGSYVNPGIPISICAAFTLMAIQFNR